MNYKKIFKRETKIIAFVIVALTIVLLGSSYALFFKVKEDTNNQIVQAGSLTIEYSNTTKTIEPNENGIIECLRPQTDEEATESNGGACTFQFTVTNNGTLPSQYKIYIYNVSEGLNNPKFVSHEYIKYSLRKQENSEANTSTFVGEKEIQLLSDLKLEDESTQKRIAETSTIGTSKSINFIFKFWIDDDAPAEIIGQNVQLGIEVVNEVSEEEAATQALKSSISNKSGLIKVESIKTADEDNKEYRYTGLNPNNYVYFNCEDENDLKTCDLWRILGIYNPLTNDQTIKLIDYNSTISKEWDTNSTHTYSSSTIKQYLDNEYFNSLSPSARSKIATVPYYLNGAENLTITAEELLKQEQASTETETLNVGLMTLSDYALASGITTTLDNTDNLKNNWLFKSTAEWLLNKNTNNEIYSINEAGNIETSETNINKLIRPVVYLKSDVKILNGDGSIDNPYVLK